MTTELVWYLLEDYIDRVYPHDGAVTTYLRCVVVNEGGRIALRPREQLRSFDEWINDKQHQAQFEARSGESFLRPQTPPLDISNRSHGFHTE